MYNKVSTKLNFVEREKEILTFWNEQDIFNKSIALRENGPTYTFYDGPPTANGKPHIGHVLTRAIKDLIPRYQTMKGNKVIRKAGWDTHGLPVELEVERAVGIEGKDQIVEYGLEPFIDKCKESVWKYKGMWEDFSQTVGFWADMENPYVTYDNNFIESEWWALKKIWEKGLLYKGHKIVPYCPRCETSLSSHEVAQGYKDVKEKSVIAKFRSVDQDNLYFLAWTTTPWTLPSNVALAVNPKEEYAKVEQNKEQFILAKALVEKVFGADNPPTIVETYQGKDLEYMAYQPLFDFAQPKQKAFYVALADYVTLTDGTGIVHTAPAFGEEDSKTGHRYQLPFVQLVNDKGEFVEAVKQWQGMFVKDADPLIIEELERSGKLFKALDYEHSYPHCWRCDTPLIYYAKDTWFIEMTKVKQKMIENNNQINWLPPNIGQKRFGDWLENLVDWGLSRDRFWGTPLNIWECDCGHRHAIGSIEELKAMSEDCPADIELHRPFVDRVHIKCDQCGKQMTRVEPVIDCWFDSGAMPFAQWHYPFENEEIFKDNFPADFISEAVDQTRGWFYSLLAISTLIFEQPSYKNVIVLGLVQDENGQKMSKSKGNAVDPFAALEEFGADAIRWYFYNNSAPWLPNRFYKEAVVEGQRKFMGTLWNTYAFYVLYANIDGFNPKQYELDSTTLSPMDKWCLSKLNSLVRLVDDNMSQYKITESTRAIAQFVDDLSNWYVRRSRERFWQKEMNQDKINAYLTLYQTLTTLSRLLAPFIPFMTEDIYRNLVVSIDSQAPASVHFCDYPTWQADLIDKDLEAEMEIVLQAVVAGRSARNGANIKNRQPLAKMYVKYAGQLRTDMVDIIRQELNIKQVELAETLDRFITYEFKPQLRTVGPKYGKHLAKIKDSLAALEGQPAMTELKQQGHLSFEYDGDEVILKEEDLLISTGKLEGFETVSEGEMTVVLDTNLSPELIEEGFVREIISKIQTMRKEADYEVTDSIKFNAQGNDKIDQIIKANQTLIMQETLIESIQDAITGYTKKWNINNQEVEFTVAKVV